MKRFLMIAVLAFFCAAWYVPANAQWGGLPGPQKQLLYAAAYNLPPITGTWFWVDVRDGKASASGVYPDEAIDSLKAALAKCRNGYGDGVVIVSSDTSAAETALVNVTARCTVKVTGVSLVGISPGGRQVKISTKRPAATSSDAQAIYVKAPGVRMYNLLIENRDSLGYVAVKLSKEALNFYAENCWFVGGTNAKAGCSTAVASVQIDSVKYATFKKCDIGSYIPKYCPKTAHSGQLYLNGPQLGHKFIDCNFYTRTDSVAQACAIKVGAANTVQGPIVFDNCLFYAQDGTDSLVAAVGSVVNGTAQTDGQLIFKNIAHIGYVALDTIDAALSYSNWNAVDDTLSKMFAR